MAWEMDKRKRTTSDLVAVIIMAPIAVFFGGYLLTSWDGREAANAVSTPGERTPSEQFVSLAGAPVRGTGTAPVVVVVYADFECSACRGLATEILPAIYDGYVAEGEIDIAFRHFPLGELHPSAFRSAEGAWCAGEQGRFWDMHDHLFETQPERSDAALSEMDVAVLRAAEELELDLDRFSDCLSRRAGRPVRLDAGHGLALGIDATPTLLIGTREPGDRVRVVRLVGGAPADPARLAVILDEVLGDTADATIPGGPASEPERRGAATVTPAAASGSERR